MFRKFLLVVFLLIPGLLQAQGRLSEADIRDLLDVKIRFATHIAFQPNVIRAVEAQNRQDLSLDEIKERDAAWIKNKDGTNALIREITRNEIASYFRRRVENNSAIDEIFLTDFKGANVAAYPPTSDYWQGDEEKWSASYNNGDGKVFIGPLEADESTNKTLVQISAPVISNNQTIGVLVLGVSVDYIEAQQ